jgi:hypothetical protein
MAIKQILNTSSDAARFVTGLEGWVDRHGRFCGTDEHMARWSGCTHIICPKCGKPTPKSYTICEDCREEKAIERYKARERREWDGKTPLYSEAVDEYFFDEDSLRDHLETHEVLEQVLRLVICEPNRLRQVEEDYFLDDLPEDGDIPDEVANALEDLNRVIRDQDPVSWSPGRYVPNRIIE